MLNGYGQAEIGEVIGWTAADAREHPEKVGAVGRPHPGVAIKVRRRRRRVAPTDAVGRLLVRPPRMAAGYATAPTSPDRIDADGFVDTGDLARVDDDGFVWIEGRAGDVINRGGNKVFPDHGRGGAAARARRRATPAWSACPTTGSARCRSRSSSADATVDRRRARRARCREHLAPYKVPVAFHRVDALPRTEVGKVAAPSCATCAPGAARRELRDARSSSGAAVRSAG